jgi:branched-chain amino acid aminotransferase
VTTRIFIDGEVRDETATVPILDRGFLYGDSVYEVTRTIQGLPVDLSRHLERLERSAALILMAPPPREQVSSAIARTLAEAGNPDSYIRIVVTRGEGELGLDPALSDRPRLVVIVRSLALPPQRLYDEGVPVALVGVLRIPRQAFDPAAKSGNYLNNILALAEAKRSGGYESIMCNVEGRLVEGSTSNLFLVKGGELLTPSLDDGLLHGITRRRVLELAAAEGIPTREAHLVPADLKGAAEGFLTSSVRGVLPISTVDGNPLGEGRPGEITRRLLALYDRFLARVASGQEV